MSKERQTLKGEKTPNEKQKRGFNIQAQNAKPPWDITEKGAAIRVGKTDLCGWGKKDLMTEGTFQSRGGKSSGCKAG